MYRLVNVVERNIRFMAFWLVLVQYMYLPHCLDSYE
jgi:hypothetical protein